MPVEMILEKGRVLDLKYPEILMFDKNWKFLKNFKNIQEVKRAGFDWGHVKDVCKGERNFHKGYRWKFNLNK